MNRNILNVVLASSILMSGFAIGATQPSLEKWGFAAGRTTENTPVCTIFVASTAGPVKNIMVKSFAGHGMLNLSLYKDSWNIPSGQQLTVSIDFMDDQPLLLDAYGNGKTVTASLPKEYTSTFLGLMIDSSIIRVTFASGNEQPWKAQLSGAKSHMKEFIDCARKQENTQPF